MRCCCRSRHLLGAFKMIRLCLAWFFSPRSLLGEHEATGRAAGLLGASSREDASICAHPLLLAGHCGKLQRSALTNSKAKEQQFHVAFSLVVLLWGLAFSSGCQEWSREDLCEREWQRIRWTHGAAWYWDRPLAHQSQRCLLGLLIRVGFHTFELGIFKAAVTHTK